MLSRHYRSRQLVDAECYDERGYSDRPPPRMTEGGRQAQQPVAGQGSVVVVGYGLRPYGQFPYGDPLAAETAEGYGGSYGEEYGHA
jgi:hypothetical protein